MNITECAVTEGRATVPHECLTSVVRYEASSGAYGVDVYCRSVWFWLGNCGSHIVELESHEAAVSFASVLFAEALPILSQQAESAIECDPREQWATVPSWSTSPRDPHLWAEWESGDGRARVIAERRSVLVWLNSGHYEKLFDSQAEAYRFAATTFAKEGAQS